MNRATDTDAARFGFEAGREAGRRETIAAVATAMIERGHPAAVIAPILRDVRTVR